MTEQAGLCRSWADCWFSYVKAQTEFLQILMVSLQKLEMMIFVL